MLITPIYGNSSGKGNSLAPSTPGVITPIFNSSGQRNTPTPTAQPTQAPTPTSTPANPIGSAISGVIKGGEQVAGNVINAIKGEFTQPTPTEQPVKAGTPVKLPGGLKVDFVTPSQDSASAAPSFQRKVATSAMQQTQTETPGQTYLKPYNPTIWDKIGEIFNNVTGYDANTQKALAMNAYALKTQFPNQTKDYSLSQLAQPGGDVIKNSPAENVTKQIGVRQEPTSSEFANILMTAAAGMGLIEAPVAAVKALGLWSGVNALKSGVVSALSGQGFKPLSGATFGDLVPNAPPQLKAFMNLVDFLTTSAITHQIYTKAPGAFEQLTKQTITKYQLPRTLTVDPATLKDIQNGGKVTPQDVQDAFAKLGLTGSERAQIAKGNAIDINIPAVKVTTIADRPYWSAIKSIFRIAPNDPTVISDIGGAPTATDHIAGLLPSGEYTPQEVRQAILQSPVSQTNEGKTMIDASIQAEKQGKNMQISKPSQIEEPTTAPAKPSFTSKEARFYQDDFTKQLDTLREKTTSQEDHISQEQDLFVKNLDAAEGNRNQLAGIRTALNKEMMGFAGKSGSYKSDYAMFQALKDSPDFGKYLQTLEHQKELVDNLLFMTDDQIKSQLQTYKEELKNLPQDEGTKQLGQFITDLSSTKPMTGEARYALDTLTNVSSFEEFSKAVADLQGEFDNEFTALHNDIVSGKITASDYESFSKQYSESFSSSTGEERALNSESGNKGAEANQLNQEAQGGESKPANAEGSELNGQTRGSEDTRLGSSTDRGELGTDRAAGTGERVTPHYDYQSTQFDLPKAEADKFRAFADRIPEEDLYIDAKESIPGKETDPHVTVLYGLANDVTPQQLKILIGDTAPITITFGKTSTFSNEKYDVLKVDAESHELRALNDKIAEAVPTPGATFPDYQPHATIAYMKKGTADKFVGNKVFEGDQVTLHELQFSKQDGSKITIPLSGGVEDMARAPLSKESFRDTELAEYLPNTEAGFIDPQEIVKSVTDALETYKKNQEDTRFGEALRAYFVGNRDIRIAETNQLVEQFGKKIKLPVQQEALTLMRDFKGREDQLPLLLDGLHPYYDKAVERFKEANPDATPKEVEEFATKLIERGKKLTNVIKWAMDPTEEMKQVDAQMTDYFRSRLEEGQKLGFLDSKIKPEEYINHLLQPKEEVKPSKGLFASKNKIGRYFSFAKGRAYKDVVEAYLNGVNPRTLNALDAMSIYGDKHAVAAATHLLIKELKTTELGKFGSRKSEHIPADWEEVAPESNLFKNEIPFIKEFPKEGMSEEQIAAWDKKVEEGRAKFNDGKYQEADAAHQSLFAPKKVVDALKPITGGDTLNNLPGFAKMRLYQGYIKAMELGLSVFHMRAMTITSMANQDLYGTFIRTTLKDMKSPEFLEQERNFVKAGGTTSVLGRTIEAYRATRKPSVEGYILRDTPVIHQIDQIAHKLTYTTFNIMQRKFKVVDFAGKDAAWMAKHPNATPQEHYAAQRSIAKEINSAYGGLNWEIIGFGKMLQNVLRFLMLAPDWTFSNFFGVKYAFEGNTPAANASRAFIVRSLLYGYMLNQLWSILMSGQMSDDPTKAYLGKDKFGKKVYTNFGYAGLASDATNLLKNVGQYGVLEGFMMSLATKESNTIRTATQLLANRNYLGQPIIPKGAGPVVGTARSAIALAQGMSPIPFIVQNYFNMLTDPQGKYIPQEYLSILLGGGAPTHVVPNGMRQVTSGAKKGQLVRSSPPGKSLPLLQQIMTGKLTAPKRK